MYTLVAGLSVVQIELMIEWGDGSSFGGLNGRT